MSNFIITFAGNANLVEILDLLYDLTNSKYRKLGLQLGLQLPTLDNIKQACNPKRVWDECFPGMAGTERSSGREVKTNLDQTDCCLTGT